MAITVIAPQNPKVSFLHWLLQDISTQKRAEAVLQQANEVLEQRVQERTQAMIELNAQLSREIAERQRVEFALEQQIQRERLIESIAQKIRQTLDLDEILLTTVSEVRQFLRADRVVVYRFKADWSGVVTAESIAEGYPKLLYSTIEDQCFRQRCASRYQKGDTRTIANVAIDVQNPCLLQLLKRLRVRASLTVPILQGDLLWGLLIMHQCRTPRQWEPFEIGLMQNLATQVAIAIQQSELYEQVQRLATTDALTQVANRYRFESFLEETWQRLMREVAPLSFILCDIDFFKAYNDSYGHPAGDRCLQTVAAQLSQEVKRPADLVARYGGEEFAIILPNTDQAGAVSVVAAIQQAIATTAIEHREAPEGVLTLSYGIVTVVPDPQKKISALIQAADNQLYQAKMAGRNQWQAIALDP